MSNLYFRIFLFCYLTLKYFVFTMDKMGTQSVMKITKQQLVLISGCTGTGKSLFGMEVAINRGILKCISTSTIRQVHRTFDSNPVLHRSTYGGEGDPIYNWRESADLLKVDIESTINDNLVRGTSLVLEGVHIVPCNELIRKWEEAGGVAVGCVLCIPDEDLHRQIVEGRAKTTFESSTKKLGKFDRIRAIHDEMVRLGNLNNWLIINQKPSVDPRPIDMLNDQLYNVSKFQM